MTSAHRRSTVAFIEEVEFMHAASWSTWDIARALGSTPEAIYMRLRRAGRRDLSERFRIEAQWARNRRGWRAS